MRTGTTQPGRSEDLWAQVAMTSPGGGPHTEADFLCGGAWSSTGRVNAGHVRGHGGAGLNLDGPAEGSVLNCKVPAA